MFVKDELTFIYRPQIKLEPEASVVHTLSYTCELQTFIWQYSHAIDISRGNNEQEREEAVFYLLRAST